LKFLGIIFSVETTSGRYLAFGMEHTQIALLSLRSVAERFNEMNVQPYQRKTVSMLISYRV